VAKTIAAPFKALFDRLLAKLGLKTGEDTLVVPAESSGESGKAKVTVAVTAAGEVLIGTSPGEPFDEIKPRIKADKVAEAQTLHNKVVELTPAAKTEKEALKGKKNAPAKKPGEPSSLSEGAPAGKALSKASKDEAEFLEKHLVDHCLDRTPPFKKVTKASEYNAKYKTWTEMVVAECDGSKKGVTNPHGHHIVMKGDAYPENAKSRQILCKHGINPFTDCRNLVVARNWCHSKEYAVVTLKRLTKADLEGTPVENVLKILAAEFATCKFGGIDLSVDDVTDEL